MEFQIPNSELNKRFYFFFFYVFKFWVKQIEFTSLFSSSFQILN